MSSRVEGRIVPTITNTGESLVTNYFEAPPENLISPTRENIVSKGGLNLDHHYYHLGGKNSIERLTEAIFCFANFVVSNTRICIKNLLLVWLLVNKILVFMHHE